MDDLENLSKVGSKTADSLAEAGYQTYVSIAAATASQLAERADIGESTATKIIRSARQEADLGTFKTGKKVKDEKMKKQKELFIIPSKKSIDDDELSESEKDLRNLLQEGVKTGQITEFSGSPNSGKTQTLHQLSVNAQLPESVGGLNGKVFYIDTETTFSDDRIEDMVHGLEDEVMEVAMEDRGIEPADAENEESVKELTNQILEGISVSRTKSSNHQVLMVEKAREIANKHNSEDNNERDYKLMIIDSLTAHFRAEYVGRGNLAERQQKLGTHLQEVKSFAESEEAVAVCSNQVSADPQSQWGSAQTIGGNVVGHTKDYEIRIKSTGRTKDKIIYDLRKASNLDQGKAPAKIVGDGIKPA